MNCEDKCSRTVETSKYPKQLLMKTLKCYSITSVLSINKTTHITLVFQKLIKSQVINNHIFTSMMDKMSVISTFQCPYLLSVDPGAMLIL